MRRAVIYLLAAAMLLSLLGGCGRGGEEEQAGNPVLLYYEVRDAEDLSAAEVIAAEERNLDVISLMEFFRLYFAGPASENLISPFPPHTEVLDIQYSGDVLSLTLSDGYFSLMGVNLALANCCIAKTVESYTGSGHVILTDETGHTRLEVEPEMYLLSNDIVDASSVSFSLYFSDQNHRYLIQETRTAVLSRNDAPEAYLMRQLLEGPENERLEPILPKGTALRSISVADAVCTLDLSREFLENRSGDPYEDYMTIYGVTDTLTGLEQIEAVRFLCEGETISYFGPFPLDVPVLRNAGCIGPARLSNGELDVNLFVRCDASGEPFEMPCRVRQTVSEPMAQAVTAALLSYEPPPGFTNPIPYGTELQSISVSGSVCYVDLSDKFIPQEDTEQAERAAVWALVMSLTDLDGVSSVLLTINGESGGLQFVDISEPLGPRNVSLD